MRGAVLISVTLCLVIRDAELLDDAVAAVASGGDVIIRAKPDPYDEAAEAGLSPAETDQATGTILRDALDGDEAAAEDQHDALSLAETSEEDREEAAAASGGSQPEDQHDDTEGTADGAADAHGPAEAEQDARSLAEASEEGQAEMMGWDWPLAYSRLTYDNILAVQQDKVEAIKDRRTVITLHKKKPTEWTGRGPYKGYLGMKKSSLSITGLGSKAVMGEIDGAVAGTYPGDLEFTWKPGYEKPGTRLRIEYRIDSQNNLWMGETQLKTGKGKLLDQSGYLYTWH